MGRGEKSPLKFITLMVAALAWRISKDCSPKKKRGLLGEMADSGAKVDMVKLILKCFMPKSKEVLKK